MNFGALLANMVPGKNHHSEVNDEDDIPEEEMDEEQKHKNWLSNRQFLYDHMITHKMETQTLALQWLPDKHDSENMVDYKFKLLVGTNCEEDSGSNYLGVLSVELPKFKSLIDLAEIHHDKPDPMKPLVNRHSVRILRKYPHNGEVSKIGYMPQNPNIVATKTNYGDLNLYHLDKPDSSGLCNALTGLSSDGFALDWDTTKSGQLASSGLDGVIGIWDSNHPGPGRLINNYKIAINDLKFNRHKDNVVGLAMDDKSYIL